MRVRQLALMVALAILSHNTAEAKPVPCPVVDAFGDFLALATRIRDFAPEYARRFSPLVCLGGGYGITL